MCEGDDRQLKVIDYKDVGLMFKSTLSREEFRDKILKEIIGTN